MTDASPSPAGNSWLLPISLVVILALVVAVFWPRPIPVPPVVVTPATPGTVATTPVPAEYAELLTVAREAQLKAEWCAACEAFQKLSDKLDADKAGLVELRDEAARNLRMLASLCPDKGQPDTIPVPDVGVEVEVPKKKVLPEPLLEEAIVDQYPVGKTIRSIGHFVMNGKGSNKSWGVRGTASFSYFSAVPVVTRVVESDARTGRLVFEQTFDEVVQLRAVSNPTLELAPPDSPVLRTVWPTADPLLKRLSPGYNFFRRVTDAINATDPGLKNTLTRASTWLRRGGIEVTATTPDTELAIQVEKLSGSKLRIVYVSGLGVTQISRLEGVPFNRDELIRLAHASTVLVDYFVIRVIGCLNRAQATATDYAGASQIAHRLVFAAGPVHRIDAGYDRAVAR